MARLVTLSLDEDSFKVWDSFTRGTRSARIRAILKDAATLDDQILINDALRRQIAVLKVKLEHAYLELGYQPESE